LGRPGDSVHALTMAAVLACGEGAAACRQSAAYLYEALPYPTSPPSVSVLVDRAVDSRPGISVHRTASIDRRDRRLLGRIPVTSPARTLLDLAAGGSDTELEQAFDEMWFRGLVRHAQIAELLARSRGARGIRKLRALFAAETAGERNRREAEKRMAALIRSAGLPPVRANARVGRYIVDFLWPDHRVAVELDGFATHGRRAAFEADRARDGDLHAFGIRVVRVTWRQLCDEPQAVIARVAAALGASGGEL
jgi:very-short-patch-repair endonuclease